MILTHTNINVCQLAFPRTRGDDPDDGIFEESEELFSPHPRG